MNWETVRATGNLSSVSTGASAAQNLGKSFSLLISSLIRREVASRYRGSVLGILWSLLTPLLMLAVYTFVFGAVLRVRWAGMKDDAPIAEFAIILFCGLIIFQFFSEVITRAPTLILSNVNYIKKVIFPLEILAPVALGSSLFHLFVSFVVLFVFMLVVHGGVPLTAILLPMVLIPLCLLTLGLSWFLASLGTYVRDVNQILGTIVTAMLFLSPIFFSLEALPEWIRPIVRLNPIAVPVEQAREVVIFGRLPDWSMLAVYTVTATAIAWLGYLWFQKTRKGFADVL